MSGWVRERNYTGTETLFGTYFVPGTSIKAWEKSLIVYLSSDVNNSSGTDLSLCEY